LQKKTFCLQSVSLLYTTVLSSDTFDSSVVSV